MPFLRSIRPCGRVDPASGCVESRDCAERPHGQDDPQQDRRRATPAMRARKRIEPASVDEVRPAILPAFPGVYGALRRRSTLRLTMARPTSFGRDTGLQARMLLTMFLLGLVYVVFMGVLFAAGAGAITIVVFAGVPVRRPAVRVGQARAAGDGRQGGLARRGAGAARDDRAALRPGRPAQAAGSPWPTCRCPTRSPWAARRSSSTVCATTGIMSLLSPAELEGVMAHELTHIANRDVAIMTAGELLRLDRLDDHPVRLLLRRRHGGSTTTTARASSSSCSSRWSSTSSASC